MEGKRKTERERFTEAFYIVLEQNPGVAPGPTPINRVMGKTHALNQLSGRLSALRTELLLENGFRQEQKWGRWL